jgi:hypothetical protein
MQVTPNDHKSDYWVRVRVSDTSGDVLKWYMSVCMCEGDHLCFT